MAAYGPDGAGHVAAEEGIELPDRDEARIARAGRVAVGIALRSGDRLAESVRHVQDHRLQVDLGQGVGGNQVEVVARVLRRVVQVGDVDHGNPLRRPAPRSVPGPNRQYRPLPPIPGTRVAAPWRGPLPCLQGSVISHAQADRGGNVASRRACNPSETLSSFPAGVILVMETVEPAKP